MKPLYIALAALALAGCAPQKIGPKTYPAYVPEPLDMSAYTAEIQPPVDPALSSVARRYSTEIGRIIYAGVNNPAQFAGAACTLRITVDAEGKPVKMSAEDATTAYCRALLTAAKAATFPPRPLHITADLMPLDFKEMTPRVMTYE